MRYTDHSRTSLDDTCPRARYWGYEYQGLGVAPVEPNADLTFGLAIAQHVQALREGHTPTVASLGDMTVLAQGLLEAYRTRIWPTWLQEFEYLAGELECGLSITPDLYYMARPDTVIRRKADDTVWVLSDKTTSLAPETFVRQWDKAAQNHAECLAVEQALGRPVSGFYTQGWYKGYKKAGTIYSPLAYAWCKEGQPGLTRDQWQAEYKYGWPRRPISAYPGGVEAWVKQLPLVVIQQQFPVAGPIGLRRDLVDTYLRQIGDREVDMIDPTVDTDLFPQRFQHCDEFGKYRRPCAFKDCCWVPMVGRDPIGSGLFTPRQPHHEPERKQVAYDTGRASTAISYP